MKKEEEKKAQEEQRIQNDFLNRNMLNEEDIWAMIADNSSKTCQISENSTGSHMEPSAKQIAREFTRSLPLQPRKNIFVNEFELFTMAH